MRKGGTNLTDYRDTFDANNFENFLAKESAMHPIELRVIAYSIQIVLLVGEVT